MKIYNEEKIKKIRNQTKMIKKKMKTMIMIIL